MADEYLALGLRPELSRRADGQSSALFGAVVDSIDQGDFLDGKVVAGLGLEQYLEGLGQVAIAAGIDDGDHWLLVFAHLDGVADGIAICRSLAIDEGDVVRTRALDLEGDAGSRTVEPGGD